MVKGALAGRLRRMSQLRGLCCPEACFGAYSSMGVFFMAYGMVLLLSSRLLPKTTDRY